mmetsp:Transcript_23739/g.39215  ORF Transcript_23739/g.39215 Transcript_23739/m.39215 type:complete len:525 (+) Transcript_23739:34-1608(+)
MLCVGNSLLLKTTQTPHSPNVLRVYAQTGVSALGKAILHGQAVGLSQFLYALRPDVRIVGIISGAQGVVRLLAAIAVGPLVDRFSRNTLLCGCSLLGICTHTLLAFLITWPEDELVGVKLIPLLGASVALIGVYDALQQTLSDVIFADSVPTGRRCGPYSNRQIVCQASMLASPLLQLGCFTFSTSNDWALASLRPMMLVGVGFGGFGALLIASLDHDKTLTSQSEAVHVASADSRKIAATCTTCTAMGDSAKATEGAAAVGMGGLSPRAVGNCVGLDHAVGSCATGSSCAAAGVTVERMPAHTGSAEYVEVSSGTMVTMEAEGAALRGAANVEADTAERTAWRVRWLIFWYDILRVCSGGLVVKFISLFFSNVWNLSPRLMAVVVLCCFLSQITFTSCVGKLCAAYGLRRGAVCLSLLLLCDMANFLVALVPSLPVVVVAWVVREGSLGAVFGLKKSLMMDHTPKNCRGRWNAVDSLQSSFWSGTAVLGGFVVHIVGYSVDLIIMSLGFVVATALFVPLATKR